MEIWAPIVLSLSVCIFYFLTSLLTSLSPFLFSFISGLALFSFKSPFLHSNSLNFSLFVPAHTHTHTHTHTLTHTHPHTHTHTQARWPLMSLAATSLLSSSRPPLGYQRGSRLRYGSD